MINFLRANFLVLIAIVLMYFNHLQYWTAKWMDFGSFYSIGLLVLVFIYYFIKDKRKELAQIPPTPSKLGMPIIFLSLAMYYIGTKADIKYFSSFSFPGLIAGITLSLYGKKILMKILPALLFFTVSLPIFPIFRVAMPFQLILAEYTSHLMNFLGLNASYSGSLMTLENQFIDIEAGCAGVSSLYSLFIATFMYIYYKKIKLIHKICLIGGSFIVSIAGNFTRIVISCFYLLYNGQANYENFHEYLGITMFGILLVIMFIAANALEEPDDAEEN